MLAFRSSVLVVDALCACGLIAQFIWIRAGRDPRALFWLVLGVVVGPTIVHFGADQAGLAGAAVCAIAVNATSLGWIVSRRRRVARLRAAIARFADADASRALDEADRELRALCPHTSELRQDYRAWAANTVVVASHALAAGHTARAVGWLESIEATKLDVVWRASLATHLAGARLSAGDRDGARAAIALAARPASAELEAILIAMEALLDALEGKGIPGAPPAAGPVATRIWMAAEAHADAARGAMEDARVKLLALRKEGGDSSLARVVRHEGPASSLAASILAGGGAYR